MSGGPGYRATTETASAADGVDTKGPPTTGPFRRTWSGQTGRSRKAAAALERASVLEGVPEGASAPDGLSERASAGCGPVRRRTERTTGKPDEREEAGGPTPKGRLRPNRRDVETAERSGPHARGGLLGGRNGNARLTAGTANGASAPGSGWPDGPGPLWGAPTVTSVGVEGTKGRPERDGFGRT